MEEKQCCQLWQKLTSNSKVGNFLLLESIHPLSNDNIETSNKYSSWQHWRKRRRNSNWKFYRILWIVEGKEAAFGCWCCYIISDTCGMHYHTKRCPAESHRVWRRAYFTSRPFFCFERMRRKITKVHINMRAYIDVLFRGKNNIKGKSWYTTGKTSLVLWRCIRTLFINVLPSL